MTRTSSSSCFLCSFRHPASLLRCIISGLLFLSLLETSVSIREKTLINHIRNNLSAPLHSYLLVSSPSEGTVGWTRHPSTGSTKATFPLLSRAHGIKTPHGIAVDTSRYILYVADPGSESIWLFRLFVDEGFLIARDLPVEQLKGIDSHYLTLDDQGRLFFTDRLTNTVYERAPFAYMYTTHPFVSAYSGRDDRVIAPNGLSSSGTNLYWSSTTENSPGVVKSQKSAKGNFARLARYGATPKVALKTETTVHDLHHDGTNLYYVTSRQRDPVIPHSGSLYRFGDNEGATPVMVTSQLRLPTSIGADKNGDLLVADKMLDGVYFFPKAAIQRSVNFPKTANMPQPELVLQYPSPFGVFVADLRDSEFNIYNFLLTMG